MAFKSVFSPSRLPLPVNYGGELVSDPYLTNANTIEVQSGGGTVALRTDTPPQGFSSYVRATAGDASFERIELVTDVTGLTVGNRYQVTALVRTGSVSGSDQGLYDDPTFAPSTLGFQAVDQSISGWQYLVYVYTAELTSGTPRIYVNRSGGSASDVLDIAYLSIKEISV